MMQERFSKQSATVARGSRTLAILDSGVFFCSGGRFSCSFALAAASSASCRMDSVIVQLTKAAVPTHPNCLFCLLVKPSLLLLPLLYNRCQVVIVLDHAQR